MSIRNVCNLVEEICKTGILLLDTSAMSVFCKKGVGTCVVRKDLNSLASLYLDY